LKNKILTKDIQLRQKAEERLKNLKLLPDFNPSEYDVLKLMHELQVHQIELEMQNDEINLAKENAEGMAEKYLELYNLAPLGYFTITKQHDIIDLNHFGLLMLTKEHDVLEKSNFGYFVVTEDKPTFNSFIEKIFDTNRSETCVVTMTLDQNETKQVLLTGNVNKNKDCCLLAAIDITERMMIEKKSNELKQFNDYFIGRELRMVELKKEVNELCHKNGLENKYPV
jgi:PAS domain-containing protein